MTTQILAAALYKFAHIPDPSAVRAVLKATMLEQGIKGSLLVAHEGLNGTIAGTRESLDALLGVIRAIPGFADLEHKESPTTGMPFKRTKVLLKKEIVTMKVPEIDPNHIVGTYIAPQDWNQLLADPDTVLIDTRNDFEYQHGTFANAINPQTRSFGEFPAWFQAHRAEFAGKKIAMFCTGGIRCEKATAYVKQQGFDEVYHLKGGILKYLEEVPPDQSTYRGTCFVFDERVSLGHGLEITGAPSPSGAPSI